MEQKKAQDHQETGEYRKRGRNPGPLDAHGRKAPFAENQHIIQPDVDDAGDHVDRRHHQRFAPPGEKSEKRRAHAL
ncbi:hypothetical protein SDC9_74418 [bioreactor metagenome]|uniref:Uncharacterized protein n=1 Tax=bioreactor metagenome TaxID=1076179 RepID=A0A644YN14_9ZZZZ